MLTSKAEIMYAFNLTDYMFWEYIEQGMPALYLKGRWSASISVINEWWRRSRGVMMRDVMKQVRDDEKRYEAKEGRME